MSKYRAVRTNGYASKREAKRAAELRLLFTSGVILDLREQVAFDLLPAAPVLGYKQPLRYVADFCYRDFMGGIVGPEIVEDVKGIRTPVYKLKKRLMAQLLGITITEV